MPKQKHRNIYNYDPVIAQEICDTVSCCSKGIRNLCEERPHWPCPDTIFKWRQEHKDFADRYTLAKQVQVECLIDEILMIADDTSADRKVREDGKEFVDKEHINRSRLKIDTRKWLAAKLVPRLYGDKVQHELSDFKLTYEQQLKQLE